MFHALQNLVYGEHPFVPGVLRLVALATERYEESIWGGGASLTWSQSNVNILDKRTQTIRRHVVGDGDLSHEEEGGTQR